MGGDLEEERGAAAKLQQLLRVARSELSSARAAAKEASDAKGLLERELSSTRAEKAKAEMAAAEAESETEDSSAALGALRTKVSSHSMGSQHEALRPQPPFHTSTPGTST